MLNRFDYSQDDDQHEFTVAECNPGGQSIVIGSFDRFNPYFLSYAYLFRIHSFNYSASRNVWEEAPVKQIDGFYTVSALAWKPDGSRLIAVSHTSVTH
jgi:intraflagellar transport protein 172